MSQGFSHSRHSDDDFNQTIANGIAKVNIFTDLCIAGEHASKESIEMGQSYLDMRNNRVEEIKEAIKKKLQLFGSAGKA